MEIDELKLPHRISQSQLLVYLEGITAEQALWRPEKGGNPVNWILGHILAERFEMLDFLGFELPVAWPELPMYVTGSTAEESGFLPFDTLTALIPETHATLLAALDAMSEADLEAPQPGTLLGQPYTLGRNVLTYALHEMYHIGQISLLRRSLGLPGAG